MSERYHRQLTKLEEKKNEFDKNAFKQYKMMLLRARQSKSIKSKIYRWYLEKGISKSKRRDFEVPKWMRNSQNVFRTMTGNTHPEKECKISIYQKTKARMNRRLLFISVFNIVLWGILSCIFYTLEKSQWDYLDSLWFCFVAFSTLGDVCSYKFFFHVVTQFMFRSFLLTAVTILLF
ncbi:hypothetical protein AYI68_g2162 [Smittium mucronatum]|uniref:Potassium channel domain-containing protein n=1 Tax=Smittium mucronatum TaxID=133383 RepID=A0A1R0H3I8_9FUNG|nr:hypothetical protein AYI68_g2162 [Smittium mucronatum]